MLFPPFLQKTYFYLAVGWFLLVCNNFPDIGE